MSEFHIELESGAAVRLPTAGKYCDRDIVVTAAEGSRYEDGFADGQQSEQDRFWDVFQQNGNRADYQYAFYNWDDACYNAKHPIDGVVANSFRGSNITNTQVPIVAANSSVNAFYNCSCLVTIPSLDISGSSNTSYMFLNCIALVDVRFVGEITLSLSLAQSKKLNKASIESIINALSATASGQTLTLSKNAVDNAFAPAEWTSLVGTKSNWTISLV